MSNPHADFNHNKSFKYSFKYSQTVIQLHRRFYNFSHTHTSIHTDHLTLNSSSPCCSGYYQEHCSRWAVNRNRVLCVKAHTDAHAHTFMNIACFDSSETAVSFEISRRLWQPPRYPTRLHGRRTESTAPGKSSIRLC